MSGLPEVIVVGAGVAGLTFGRDLQSRGYSVVILERARGVGGRCATRRVVDQPVDHGLPFLHGRGERFLAELDAVHGVTVVRDWPNIVEGDGLPCRPEAFTGRERRLTFIEGVSQFPKHLSRGLDVRLGADVAGLALVADRSRGDPETWELRLRTGGMLRARAVALSMPAPSIRELLEGIDPLPAPIAAALPVIELVQMLPCLTVIARYPFGTLAPPWEVNFPRESAAIHSILHDSSKRGPGARLMLVIQARPVFSAAHMNDPVESWSRRLLEEAGALHGDWAAAPELVQAHPWRRARVAPGSELARPLAIRLEAGALLGIAGDGFHDTGGVEGAYRSGIALAERFAESLEQSA